VSKTKEGNCSGPGCEEKCCPPPQTASDDLFSSSYPSVGVKKLDDEHNECLASLRKLHKSKTLSDLKSVQATLRRHFQHEEKLFKTTGFDDGGQFSKTFSHCKDHEMMIAEMDEEIARCEKAQAAGVTEVSTSFVIGLAKRLKEHTELYDMQYSSFMATHFKDRDESS